MQGPLNLYGSFLLVKTDTNSLFLEFLLDVFARSDAIYNKTVTNLVQSRGQGMIVLFHKDMTSKDPRLEGRRKGTWSKSLFRGRLTE